MGPGYWGKTFWMWPPDPRTPVGDPRCRQLRRRRLAQALFHQERRGTDFDTQADPGIDKTLLANATGNVTVGPFAGAKIDYAAVLKWIKQPPMALPPNLRSGRVLYYSSIPDDVTGQHQARPRTARSGRTTSTTCCWATPQYGIPKNYTYYLTEYEYKAWPEGATMGRVPGQPDAVRPPADRAGPAAVPGLPGQPRPAAGAVLVRADDHDGLFGQRHHPQRRGRQRLVGHHPRVADVATEGPA